MTGAQLGTSPGCVFPIKAGIRFIARSDLQQKVKRAQILCVRLVFTSRESRHVRMSDSAD